MGHIVWDWNGTLFADQQIVFEAVNTALRSVGAEPVDSEVYRGLPKRPVRAFYELVVGRPLTDAEWHTIDHEYHVAYLSRMDETGLAPDATDVLTEARQRGFSQSLLSMWPHEDLLPLVERYGLTAHFLAIEGYQGPCGGLKADHMGQHLGTLRCHGVAADQVTVVGDSVDDATAAGEHGVPAVLIESATYHPEVLRKVGVPVAPDLRTALDLCDARPVATQGGAR